VNEFEIIERFFVENSPALGVKVGPGDDCAVLEVSSGEQLIVTTDTLVEQVHFPVLSPPEKLGYRSCATALSDIAAMGGRARWASLALTLPEMDSAWLTSFVAGFRQALSIDETSLVGGDLTRGPLSITWHITGTVNNNGAILRSGAKVGDEIYVSGQLGAAAYALNFLAEASSNHACLAAYWSPTPRLALGRELARLASCCIDISDGLLADLSHILKASGKGANIECPSIPVHPALHELDHAEQLQYALAGGDEYELCFTSKPGCTERLEALSRAYNLPLTRIGEIVEMNNENLIHASTGEALHAQGYKHF